MDTPPLQPGDLLAGKYRVERVLGVGGMGVVVAAIHLDLLERRAIKFMLPTALSDAEAVARFLREARAASRLQSEHVARVYDVGRLDNGAPYMVMEYLEGSDLNAILKRRGPLPIQEVVSYLLQVGEALAEAHASGIIHRDLKPANLFLTQRRDGSPSIKVLDFGISKMANEAGVEHAVTSTYTVLGSPQYMSPEQMRSTRDVDARTDIWSLGVIAYHLLSGRRPYDGQSVTEVIAAVLEASPVPLSQVRLDIPPALETAVIRCLEKNPQQRCASVAEFASLLLPVASPADTRSVALIQGLLGAPLPRAPMTLSAGSPAASQPVTAPRAWGTTSADKHRPSHGTGILLAAAIALLGGAIGTIFVVVHFTSREGAAPEAPLPAAVSAAVVAAPAASTSAVPTPTRPPEPPIPPAPLAEPLESASAPRPEASFAPPNAPPSPPVAKTSKRSSGWPVPKPSTPSPKPVGGDPFGRDRK